MKKKKKKIYIYICMYIYNYKKKYIIKITTVITVVTNYDKN